MVPASGRRPARAAASGVPLCHEYADVVRVLRELRIYDGAYSRYRYMHVYTAI